MSGGHELTVAVVTGGHSFDVPGFQRLLRAIPGVDAYVQSLENWADDVGGVRDRYDVTLFYNMHTETPTGDEPWPFQKVRETLEGLGRTEQGILVLHHAVVAFPKWPYWDELVGIEDRAVEVAFGVPLRVNVADRDHPITAGVEPFDIVDESYAMNDAGQGCRAVLRVDHPASMQTVGWTRMHGDARVLCLQLGHDDVAWQTAGFRAVLERGILWCARRI